MRSRASSLLVLSLLWSGCGCHPGGTGLTTAERKTIAGITRSLNITADASMDQHAALMAEITYEEFGLQCFGDYAGADEGPRGSILLDCGFACSPEAADRLRARPQREWGPLLVESCGPARYGLEPDQAALLSPAWDIVRRLGSRIAPLYARADAPTRRALDEAMAKMEVPLPAPAIAEGLYELPAAGDSEKTPAEVITETSVIVAADGRLIASATPIARLTGRGAEVRGKFPGWPVKLEGLGTRLRELSGQSVSGAPDAAPAGGDTRGAAPQAGTIGVVERDPDFHGDVNSPEPTTGEAAHLPLILVDRATPTERLMEVLDHTGGGYLAVAGPGQSAFALPIRFRAQPGVASSPASADPPVAVIVLGPTSLDIVIAQQHHAVPQRPDGSINPLELRAWLQPTILASGGSGVVVYVDGETSYARLVSLLNRIVREDAVLGEWLHTDPTRIRLRVGPAPGMAFDMAAATKSALELRVRPYLPVIRRCYEHKQPAAPGSTIRVQFTFTGSGAPTRVRALDAKDPEVERCIAAETEFIVFMLLDRETPTVDITVPVTLDTK